MDADETVPPPADAFEPASVHLDAALVQRRGSPFAKAARAALSIAAGLLTNDMESGPSAIELVVRRRSTGNEVIRLVAGTPTEADALLRAARRDLATKGVADFLAEWAPAPRPSPGPDPADPPADPDAPAPPAR